MCTNRGRRNFARPQAGNESQNVCSQKGRCIFNMRSTCVSAAKFTKASMLRKSHSQFVSQRCRHKRTNTMIAGNVRKVSGLPAYVACRNSQSPHHAGRSRWPNKIRPDKPHHRYRTSRCLSFLVGHVYNHTTFYSPSRACRGGAPRPGILFAPDSATMLVARRTIQRAAIRPPV